MTIQKKLLSNFLLVAAVVLVCSIFGIWSIRQINASLDYVTARAWTAANAAMQTSIDNLTRIVAAEEYLKGDREQARFLIRRAEDRFNTKFEELRKTQLADETVLNNIKELWNKLTRLESKTLANYYLRNRTKLQLDENALIWTKTLEKLRYKMDLSRGGDVRQYPGVENSLVSIGLLSLAERAAVNNYLAGSIREHEMTDLIEGFRSNLKRKISDLSRNPAVSLEDAKTIATVYSESEALTEKLINTHREYRVEQAELGYNTLRLVEAFENIKEKMNENMERAARAGRQLAKSSQRYFAIFAFGAFLFAIFIGIAFTRRLTKPINMLTDATQAIAKGDLGHRVNINSKDEIGQLSNSFNQMADDIHRYTEEIRQKSLQAELANQELQVTNKELYEALGELERQSNMLKETNKELEKATRLKSEFLANMSHELRTPMNSIIGFTKLVLRKSEDVIDHRQKENLQKVLISAEQLLDLINSILDLSKIESGRMEVYVEPFVMADLAAQVRELLWPLLKERDLKFTAKVDPSLPRIYSDSEKVKQILMNVVSNAVKFTEKGEIAVTINRVHARLGNRPDTDCMEILVRDTGIGISPAAQGIIFEDFRQADGSATRKYGGTGLGLSICRRLCQLLGGSIVLVESQPGKGSTFRILLPIDFEIEKSMPEDSQDTGRKPKFNTIMAVDDNPLLPEIVKESLASGNMEIVPVHDGMAGYQKARQKPPDLILLDLVVAKKKGWQLISRLKGDPLTAKIPVLAVSVSDKRKLSSAWEVEEYLVKPLDPTLLIKAIQQRVPPGSKNILLVDDDPVLHEICKQYLKENGYEMSSALNAEEAKKLAAKKAFDLVILDLIMPGDDGFIFLRDYFEGSAHAVKTPVFVLVPRDLSAKDQQTLEENMSRMPVGNGARIQNLADRITQLLKPAGPRISNIF